jgi:chromosome segregation ATPase
VRFVEVKDRKKRGIGEMNQIEELQTRITAALERIQRGVEARAEAEAVRKDDDATDGAELATLRQELEDERLVTAQLEERIRVLHERLEEKEAALAAAQDGQGGQSETMTRLDADLQSLRAANAQLRESNAALRTAHAAGVADPDAINASLQAELDALRAARDADRDEVAAVLAEIDSAVAGAAPGAADQTEDA